ncbi:unnamed protein product [Parnassius mnemosyne]|uniref:Uncharacterized protein n=1 Tax=Parnassius mnemosyne TaxID=213953 RepID=A0AAV1LI12_9NEOP
MLYVIDDIQTAAWHKACPKTDTEYQDAHTEISPTGHVCTISENIESNNPKQGKVGRFKARIAPGHHKNCTQKQIKQGSIKEKNPPIQSGSVLPHGHHHTKNVNHHQCCGAFGNPHVRHKASNSSCHLI